MTAAAAVIIIKERHIIDAFIAAQATSADRARDPRDLLVENTGGPWQLLCQRGIIRESASGSGTYYVDLAALEDAKGRRRTVLVVLIAVLVVLGAIAAVWGGSIAGTHNR